MSSFPAAAFRRPYGTYRALGADLPWDDPVRAHGVAMEGYFWRFTDRSEGRGRTLIALIGVNRDQAGDHWATVALGAWPTSLLATRAVPVGWADPAGLGVRGKDADGQVVFSGDEVRVRVDLGPGARLDVTIRDPRTWRDSGGGALLGGSSVFQMVPALNQYWHPWLLGGKAYGVVEVGDDHWGLDGAQVYGEKNWGKEGFPDSWWWGQAHGFDDEEACVAFAGGQVQAGPLRTEVTALVVRLPDGEVVRLGNPGLSPVQARVGDESWELSGRSLTGWRIEVQGKAPLADAHVLPVPLPAQRRNTAGAIEHLGGLLDVTVHHRGRLVWEGHSSLAGLEHGGLARAEAELRRRGIPAGAVDAPPMTRPS